MTSPGLYACGFNAFGQLLPDSKEDVFVPQEITPNTDAGNVQEVKLLFAGWSETTFYQNAKSKCDGQLIRQGSTTTSFESSFPDVVSGFGDYNGLLGLLNRNGDIALIEEDTLKTDAASIALPRNDASKIAHIALAGNGRLALMFKSLSQGEISIVEFDTFERFCQYLDNRCNFDVRHTLPSEVVQLTSNATGFVCLTQDGDVYTWGDARHGSLGRSVSETEAKSPGLVESLAGIIIKKIVSGGWMTAALSVDGAAYLFGTPIPGTQTSMSCLKGLDPTQAALVEIEDDGETLDVSDIATSGEHVLILVQDGRVFAAGDNRNGQLGLGQECPQFVEEWTQVKMPNNRQCVAVYSGPKCSFFQLEK